MQVLPAHEAPWDDVVTVFGTRGDAAHCWCQWWKLSSAEYRAASDAERCEALRVQASSSATSPGVLAYRDGVPVGWCGVEPRPRLGRVARSRTLAATLAGQDLADDGVWAVSCFVVPREHRGTGITRALLGGAVEVARAGGAHVVEAYPVDTQGRRVASASLFHGPLSLFADAGFEVVAWQRPGRPVVRLRLVPEGAATSATV
ncbi:GNAT family N-acetyltransferase [Xylanimonas ulmi]|uniref:Acetyltransferase (GNAT) family protein n=1 Tax=Xylanimonas ulmi TaxID=228973 RepID=A0A4Q7M2A2_9MICO|nr:GNAT family N-acetyltransferase [Xylanibacterium ulmi]RZS61584.1 acetyltransferase (GNAT) family protein [Xylanibacterium ulmi]